MLLSHRHHYLQLRLSQVLLQTSSPPNNVCLPALQSYRTTSYSLYLAQMVRCCLNYICVRANPSFFLILLILFAHFLLPLFTYFQSDLSYFCLSIQSFFGSTHLIHILLPVLILHHPSPIHPPPTILHHLFQ